ncbi:MAG: DUF5677 domain-containing protein [Burkholderiaceae bacterium]|nr:DUF5677 domain-containing protein [Sulfuritalea sp.]MCF8175785.1 DUF5677 domain-containing protein [Burkholderiaceae bacterium]MCF8183638.1 DUF5677 domain-containing protein [Polynucleobacter sp.]
MDEYEEPISPALDRLGENIKLLNGAVSGLEMILRRAEELDQVNVKEALPFLGLIWLYGSAIRALLEAKRQDGTMLWNAPALASLCRPLQEAFLSLVYFAIEKPEPEEAEFRRLLLSRHAIYKRWDLLRRADQSNETIARECASASVEWEAVQEVVCSHPYMGKLTPDTAKRVAKDGDQYILCSLDAIWERAGLPHELYGVTFRYLSQYAHATPYAVASLKFHQAGHENGAVNMMIPIGLALACVTQAIRISSQLDPSLGQLVPVAFRTFMNDPELPMQTGRE